MAAAMAATLIKAGETADPAFSLSLSVEEVWVVAEEVEEALAVLEEAAEAEVAVVVVLEGAAEPKTWAKTRARAKKKKKSFIWLVCLCGPVGMVGLDFIGPSFCLHKEDQIRIRKEAEDSNLTATV